MQKNILNFWRLLAISLCVFGITLPTHAGEKTDSGTAMFQLLEMKWQELADGRRLGHETTRGFFFTENPESPLHNAVVLCRNTQVFQPDGTSPEFEVSFCETQDPAGNLTWFVSNNQGSFDFLRGTGKFEGITGEVRGVGGISRQDDVHMAILEVVWKIVK